MGPKFLTVNQVRAVHQDQIDRYGGSLGIRDLGLLESAVAQPAATFGGQLLHADLHSMAAAYLFHLVQNHPFVDGNKRVGAAVTVSFLLTNGMDPRFSNDQLVDLVLNVAQGKLDKPAIAEFFRQHAGPADAAEAE